MRWQQPAKGPDGRYVLREMEHPCVNGCGDTWHLPAAERDTVVDAPNEAPCELPSEVPSDESATRLAYPAGRVVGIADDVSEEYVDFVRRFVHDRGLRWGTERD